MSAFTRTLILLAASSVIAPAMTIVLTPDAGLAANATALSAFQRAANSWGSVFSDPISVNINAGLAVLGSSTIIGQASSTLLAGGFDTIRNAMAADAANEPSNSIVAALPTATQWTGQIPAGFTIANAIVLTQANAKALGFAGVTPSDGTITFNSGFAFDYDNSDGVDAGLVDFETVALHEIGHILGFFSSVDSTDAALATGQTGQITMSTLDLFRFATTNAPTSSAQFTNNPRNLVPGAEAVFSDSVNNWRFSTGVEIGDGRQASHWKDDALSGTLIGVMDPTLGNGVIETITAADLRAFDLIGYDIVDIPEPGTFFLLGIGLAALARRRSAWVR